jgi:hypothetical protein
MKGSGVLSLHLEVSGSCLMYGITAVYGYNYVHKGITIARLFCSTFSC